MSATPGALRIRIAAADAELAADACWFLGATAISESAGEGSGVVLDVGFDTGVTATAARADLQRRFSAASVDVVDVTAALDAALDAWREHARPIRAGERLVVWPAWLPVDARPDDVVMLVDPSRAFGSGSHPSTRLCLAALERLVRPGRSVLDVGCGSGVLAVAAARLGGDPVVAIDVDEVAVAATAANARRNAVSVDASAMPVADVAGSFDVVMANIGAATLEALAPDLAARVNATGSAVLAGLLTEQCDRVIAAYTTVELTTHGRDDESGWAALVLRKPL